MPNRPSPVKTLVAVLLLSLFSWAGLANAALQCSNLSQLFDTYLKQHYQYHRLNDQLKAHTVDQFLKELDPSKTIFLEQDVANAETEMAKQQTRAATAEKELLELRERIKPRRLTDQQSQDFIAELKKATNPLVLKFGYTVGGGDESFTFLKQLLALFKDAGWNTPDKVEEISDHMDIQVVGVALLVPQPPGTDVRTPAPPTLMQLTPAEATLVSAFSKVGISVQMIRWFPGRSLELVIGSKPNP